MTPDILRSHANFVAQRCEDGETIGRDMWAAADEFEGWKTMTLKAEANVSEWRKLATDWKDRATRAEAELREKRLQAAVEGSDWKARALRAEAMVAYLNPKFTCTT